MKAGKIVNAFAVLPNFCQLRNDPEPVQLPPPERHDDEDPEMDGENDRTGVASGSISSSRATILN